MAYKNESLEKYLHDLAAKMPAPGGGSAAALTSAMAAALLCMVINFTIGKPRFAKHENALKTILERAEKLRMEFLRLVDLDVIAYKSKDLRSALDIPFMTARLSFEGIKLCHPLLKKSNLNLITDVGVAAVLFEAGFASARFNVEINLKILGDEKLSEEISRELDKKQKWIKKIRSETEDKVGKIIRG